MTMVQNGTIHSSDEPLDLGDLTPETVPVRLGGRVTWAWVITNKRYPRLVQAALDVARRRLADATLPKQMVDGPEGDPLDLLGLDDDPPETHVCATSEATSAAYRLATRQLLARFGIATLDGDDDERLLFELGNIAPPPPADAEDSETAWDKYITRCLLATVDGLSVRDAEMVNRLRAIRLLEATGVISRRQVDADSKGDEDPQSIGATPPPVSGASTPEPTTSGS